MAGAPSTITCFDLAKSYTVHVWTMKALTSDMAGISASIAYNPTRLMSIPSTVIIHTR